MKAASSQKKGLRDTVLAKLKEERPFNLGFRMMPMIDMLFLLLIFFILTMQFHAPESFLPFHLPGASAAGVQLGRSEPLTLTLKTHSGTGCSIQIGRAKSIAISAASMDADLAAVANRVRAVIAEQKRTASDPVEFVCDRGVEWQYIAKLYNVLFGMGIKDITFKMTDEK